MNDRMTELYAKACLDARDIHPTDVPAFISCMAEKFAELIVRECLSIVEPDVGMACGDEWYTALEGAAQEIKQHFGVEE